MKKLLFLFTFAFCFSLLVRAEHPMVTAFESAESNGSPLWYLEKSKQLANADFITFTSPSVNIRETPSTKGRKLYYHHFRMGSAVGEWNFTPRVAQYDAHSVHHPEKGEAAMVVGEKGQWYKILYNPYSYHHMVYGWVSKSVCSPKFKATPYDAATLANDGWEVRKNGKYAGLCWRMEPYDKSVGQVCSLGVLANGVVYVIGTTLDSLEGLNETKWDTWDTISDMNDTRFRQYFKGVGHLLDSDVINAADMICYNLPTHLSDNQYYVFFEIYGDDATP